MAENNRVYELAKHFGVTSKVLLGLLEELGVMAKSHMTVLSEEDSALVIKHFELRAAQGDKLGDRAQRFEVEKARPKKKRLSAREKLAAQREAQKDEAKKPKEEPTGEEPSAEAAPPARPPRLDRVKAPARPEPEVETAATDPTTAAPADEATTEPAAPAPKRPARTQRSMGDLTSIAKAAAETRARIVDDTKTRKAEPTAPVGRPKGGAGVQRKQVGAPATDEAKPKPIDPRAIRKSVRQTLAKLDVSRGPGGGPTGPAVPKPRRKQARRAREDKRDRVARQRARAEAQRAVDDTLRITEFITVQELAQKLGVKASDLIMKMMEMGVLATINQRLERDAIEMLVADYDVEIKWLDTSAGEDLEDEEAAGEAVARPPVVTVMGHVDHGKTTLLDHLRSANVTATEAGGITQHIGAYQVETPRGPVTFLDTPGHEAFTAMRARGAKVTDIVVVVVAADDKIMPQTVEAIDHARASNTPILIAINKIDLPAADVPGVKQQLIQHNVLVEEFGGEVQCVEISAKHGTNLDSLLEALALQAEILELTASRDGRAHGTVIEARKDPGRGTVFTVLVTQGTLKVGDPFVVGMAAGRVRAMLDEHEDTVEVATPARPVLVLGADEVPVAGDQLRGTATEREAKEVAGRRRRVQREATQVPRKRASLESLFERMQEHEQVELKLCIKGDVAGSVEALSDALLGLANEKVAVNVIHSGVGAINENDVMLSAASEAILIGFHLRPGPVIRSLAKDHHVALHLYDVIYEAVDDVKKAMTGLLEPVEREVTLGSAEVRELFRTPKAGVIAGSYVLEGTVRRNSRVRVVRDQVPIYESVVSSLRRFKEDAKDVQTGFECGIGVEGFSDLQVGDILEVFEMEKVAQEM